MDNNQPAQGLIPETFADLGPVTRGMLRERAIELARGDGRAAHEVAKSDWDLARRELAGKTEMELKESVLENAPESERWDPLPGSPGHQAPETPAEDEDAEGRNESAQMVDEGAEAAAADQTLQAARPPGKKSR